MVPVDQPTTPIPSVLFVCTANQIRSPLAVAVLKRKLVESEPNWPIWRVESAGTWTDEGRPLHSMAAVVFQERGMPLPNHRSRVVNRALLSQFRLILTMEEGHKEAIKIEFPEVASRVKVLSEIIGECKNVPDPIGGKVDDFRTAADLIEKYIIQGFDRIGELARR